MVRNKSGNLINAVIGGVFRYLKYINMKDSYFDKEKVKLILKCLIVKYLFSMMSAEKFFYDIITSWKCRKTDIVPNRYPYKQFDSDTVSYFMIKRKRMRLKYESSNN